MRDPMQPSPHPATLAAGAAAFLLMGLATLAGDRAVLLGGRIVEGEFLRFQDGAFSLKEGETETSLPAIKVETLTLDPPAPVALKLRGGHGQTEDAVLAGYEQSRFQVSRGGRASALAANQVALIEVNGERRSTAAPRSTPNATPEAPGPEPDPADIAALAHPGTVTIVHFHMASVMASVRQGSYVDTLVRDSKGKVDLVRIEVPDWKSPDAQRYGIRSAPQFWFFNRQGRLVTRLIERFTENDLDAALKQAKR